MEFDRKLWNTLGGAGCAKVWKSEPKLWKFARRLWNKLGE